MRFRRWAALALAVVSMAATLVSREIPAAASLPKGAEYYVSIGDSYAAGYQPIASAMEGRDTHGYAYQVPGLARSRGYTLVLRNFGCDGATTSTVLHQKGCELTSPGPDTVAYENHTQAAAAAAFIAGHRGRIGLITVSLSGNDILGCAAASIIVSCVTDALPSIRKNLADLLFGLRRSAGPTVPIIGITYPDVFLGLFVSNDPAQRMLAIDSVPAFESVLNPALGAAYATVGASFVDVTEATGAYTPLDEMTITTKYGTIPIAVADVCALTYYCRAQDVHPTTSGYTAIARLIVGVLPDHHVQRPRSNAISPSRWTHPIRRSPRRATTRNAPTLTLPERSEPPLPGTKEPFQ
jgi:lysophospholipase L1-like esterase